jgi:beta-xylosidase
VATVAVVTAGILIGTAVTDWQAHTRTRHEHRNLTEAESHVADAHAVLVATKQARSLADAHGAELQRDVAYLLDVLANTEKMLADTSQAELVQGLDIGTLDTCLGGVKSALAQVSDKNNAGAATALSAVATACQTLQGGSNGGLVYPFDFADPSVLLVGDTYFAYATNSVEGNIQIIESTDHTHWTPVGNALPNLPAWAAPNQTWAPDVLYIGGQYVLYYAAKAIATGQQCLSEAVAPQPQGPFTDSSTGPMVCQANYGGDIDPDAFVDANGTPYLLWKTIAQPNLIWSQQLNPAGTAVIGAGPTAIVGATQPWEDGIVEAPDLLLYAGHYFLFYSGNNWDSPSYAIGVATCAGPLGPCTKPWSQPILSSDSTMEGPGGPSVFADTSGALWIAFHAWAPGAVGYPNNRDLYIRPLNLSGAMPVVEPAS